VQAFKEALQAQDIPSEIHVYPGTQHAFFNDTRPQIYDPQAAQDAWQRTLDWFRKYLT
jgi:carboxymethylenebutenolidase